jgi:hypothetical protein
MLLISEIFYAFQIAVFVAVFQWCMQEGMILSAYRVWMERKAFEWQYGWITKPMGLCSFCFSDIYIALLDLGKTPVVSV